MTVGQLLRDLNRALILGALSPNAQVVAMTDDAEEFVVKNVDTLTVGPARDPDEEYLIINLQAS